MSNYQRSARLIVLTSLTYQEAALNADKFQRRRTERPSNNDTFAVLSRGKRKKNSTVFKGLDDCLYSSNVQERSYLSDSGWARFVTLIINDQIPLPFIIFKNLVSHVSLIAVLA